MVGLAGGCWWTSRGQDSAAQEFSKLNFRRQFSNRRREGKGRGKAQSGQRKLSLQQENLLSRPPSPSLLRSISWQWHRSRRLQKSCNNVTNFFVALSLSLFLSFSLSLSPRAEAARPSCCQNSFRPSCPLSCSFSPLLPSSVVRPVLHEMVSWNVDGYGSVGWI